ncbi:MAG: pseudouridine synthase [Bradymonadaceae bacterium]
MSDEMRIQKFLSSAGVSSRRKAEDLMTEGRVKVNGKVCTELGTKVDPSKDRVEVDGKAVTLPESMIYIAMNKPANYISSLSDPEGRPIVTDLLPQNMPRLWPVGRLDWDSEGLLLMTNDGKLTNLLTHPSHDVSKTYAVKVVGLLTNQSPELIQLREGIELDDGYVTQPARVEVVKDNGRNTWLEITIEEGKNRQVRRMFEALDRMVMKLRRISMGTITIDGLASGTYRTLTHAEVAELYGDLDAKVPDRAQPSKRALKRAREERRRKGGAARAKRHKRK